MADTFPTVAPDGPSPFDRSIARGLLVLRAAALVWAIVVAAVTRGTFRHLTVGAALIALAAAFSAGAALSNRSKPMLASHRWTVLGELAIGYTVNAADAFVHDPSQSYQTLTSVWPLAGVLACGQYFGAVTGGLAGALMGISRIGGALAASPASSFTSGRVLSLLSTTVLYVLGGALAGFTARRLRRAQREISAVQAREEVARTLHDGVLQTLAVVQRRSSDPDLARLARDQELDLRTFLFGTTRPADDVVAALRQTLAQHERRFGGSTELVVVEAPEHLGKWASEALVGAVGEALTNAAKHGAAHRITVFLDADDGVFCSVNDDGCGFDAVAVTEGIGISRSIRARLAEVGGRTEIESRPGRGTEVRLWVP